MGELRRNNEGYNPVWNTIASRLSVGSCRCALLWLTFPVHDGSSSEIDRQKHVELRLWDSSGVFFSFDFLPRSYFDDPDFA